MEDVALICYRECFTFWGMKFDLIRTCPRVKSINITLKDEVIFRVVYHSPYILCHQHTMLHQYLLSTWHTTPILGTYQIVIGGLAMWLTVENGYNLKRVGLLMKWDYNMLRLIQYKIWDQVIYLIYWNMFNSPILYVILSKHIMDKSFHSV